MAFWVKGGTWQPHTESPDPDYNPAPLGGTGPVTRPCSGLNIWTGTSRVEAVRAAPPWTMVLSFFLEWECVHWIFLRCTFIFEMMHLTFKGEHPFHVCFTCDTHSFLGGSGTFLENVKPSATREPSSSSSSAEPWLIGPQTDTLQSTWCVYSEYQMNENIFLNSMISYITLEKYQIFFWHLHSNKFPL